MADYGAKFADRKIRKVDRQLQAIYRQAQKELEKKLADFVRKSAAKDAYKQTQVKAGVITEEEYQRWLRGQVFQKQAWENRVEQIAKVMYNHDVAAAQMIHENKLDVFDENYLYSAFEAENITGISFHLTNPQTISKLIKDRDKLLPEWKIDEEKDYKWCYRKVNNAITQGIIQGESVEKIMKRLTNDLCAQDESKMRTFARTAITGAQNAGRQQEMEDAATEHKIEVHKQWMATLDNRTRDAHRHLDGQEVPYDEPFESDLGDIEYPGDPSAAPANVYNCRCTMITVYPKYKNVVNNSVRRAYGEYEGENGDRHRFSYLTADPEAYQKWKNPIKNMMFGTGGRAIEKYLQPKHESEQDKMMSLLGLKKITGDHSIEEDMKAVNPGYDISNPSTSQNCQRCVNAYVARRRGYDVVAKGIYSADDLVAMGAGYRMCYNSNEPANHLAHSIFDKLTNEEARNRFETAMESKPDGTIVILGGHWEYSGTGHVWIAEKQNGRMVYIDPQNGKYADMYFDWMMPRTMFYYDTTDKEFNNRIAEVVVNR